MRKNMLVIVTIIAIVIIAIINYRRRQIERLDLDPADIIELRRRWQSNSAPAPQGAEEVFDELGVKLWGDYHEE